MTSRSAARPGGQALPYRSPCVSWRALATEPGDGVEVTLEAEPGVVVAESTGLRSCISAGARQGVAVSGPAVRDAVLQDALTELTRESDPNFARYYDPQLSFSEYLAALEKAKLGVDLPPDHVPSATLFGFVDGSVVSLG